MKFSYRLLLFIITLTVLNGCANQAPSNFSNKSAKKTFEELLEQQKAKKKGKIFDNVERIQKGIGESMSYVLNLDNQTFDASIEGFSTLLDVTKQLNGSAKFELTKFPQQNGSRRKILILESLSAGKHNMIAQINPKDGYVKSDALALANRNSLGDSIEGIAMKSAHDNHDASVAMYASKGLPKHYIGYLQHPNSKIKHFNAGISNSKSAVRNHSELLQDVLDNVSDNYSIVSMSFRPSAESLLELSRLASNLIENEKDESYSSALGQFAQQQNQSALNKLIKINTDKKLENKQFIWLISLDNETLPTDERRSKETIANLKRLQEVVPNLFYVSSSHYLPSAETWTRDRSRFTDANIKVLTIMAAPFDFAVEGDGDNSSYNVNISLGKKYSEFSTSFATPILATVMHNMWSILPSLTPSEIFEILEKTARNSGKDTKKYGIVVDPREAYKYVLGKVLSTAYIQHIYPGFAYSNQIQSTNDTCKSWHLTNNKHNQNSLQRYHEVGVEINNVYVSKLVGDGVSIRPIKIPSTNTTSENKNQSICFKIEEVKTDDQSIQVVIRKQFNDRNTKYSDTTIKQINLKFENGKVTLVKEYPLETLSHL